jgi:hypothetical protein
MKDRRRSTGCARWRGTLRIAVGTLGAVAIAVWSFAASSGDGFLVLVAQAPAGWAPKPWPTCATRCVRSPDRGGQRLRHGHVLLLPRHNGAPGCRPTGVARPRSVDLSAAAKGNARLISRNSRTRTSWATPGRSRGLRGCHKSGKSPISRRPAPRSEPVQEEMRMRNPTTLSLRPAASPRCRRRRASCSRASPARCRRPDDSLRQGRQSQLQLLDADLGPVHGYSSPTDD